MCVQIEWNIQCTYMITTLHTLIIRSWGICALQFETARCSSIRNSYIAIQGSIMCMTLHMLLWGYGGALQLETVI